MPISITAAHPLDDRGYDADLGGHESKNPLQFSRLDAPPQGVNASLSTSSESTPLKFH